MSHWCRFWRTGGQVAIECAGAGSFGGFVAGYEVLDRFDEGFRVIGGELPSGGQVLRLRLNLSVLTPFCYQRVIRRLSGFVLTGQVFLWRAL